MSVEFVILKNGDILDGKFQIIESIGSGGMGAVYKGIDLDLSRPVAIKILTEAGDEFTERFLREAKSLAALDHPNIVPIYGIGSHAGAQYFVMKFVTGTTLENLLKRQKLELDTPFELQKIVEILKGLFSALDHAHRRGILHRDIKPANIMLDQLGRPILMDFGIVKRISDAKATQTGVIFGTPQYMAPEQAMGMEQTPATDIYSLGVVTFEMLTGRLPFIANSLYKTLFAHVHEAAPSVSDLNPLVPIWMVEMTQRMLAKAPEDRFRMAIEIVELLDQSGAELAGDSDRHSALSLAQIPIVIERRGADVNVSSGNYGEVVTQLNEGSKYGLFSEKGIMAILGLVLIGIFVYFVV